MLLSMSKVVPVTVSQFVSILTMTVILLGCIVTSALFTTTDASAYDLSLSGIPSAFQLNKESRFSIIIDLEGDESIQFEKIVISIYDIKDDLVAVGTIAPDGEIIESGNFLVSAVLVNGDATNIGVTGNDHEISYVVTVKFSSDAFDYSYGNKLHVVVVRGEGLVPLQESFAPFDIGIPPPWAMIISTVVVVDVVAMILIYSYLKARKKK